MGYTDGIMELHLQVKAARKKAGMTQEDLAERADVGRTDISRFEQGENVTMKTFLRIVGAIPDLKELNIGELRLYKDEPAVPDQAAVMRMMAGAFLQNLAGPSQAPQQTPTPGDAQPSRELSLLRTFAQFVMELAGGGKS